MTDTARTVAALKALLADNTTGSISAQDVRDVVESIVSPVLRGGFAQPYRPEPLRDRYAVFAFTPDPGNYLTLPATGSGAWSTEAMVLPLAPATPGFVTAWSFDPQGWYDPDYFLDGSDPRNTWQVTYPAGSAVMLPPGAYITTLNYQFTPTVDISGMDRTLVAYFDQIEFDANIAPPFTSDWIYEAYYNPLIQISNPDWGSTRAGASIGGVTGLFVNDSLAAKPFGIVMEAKDVTVETSIIYWDLRILQIG